MFRFLPSLGEKEITQHIQQTQKIWGGQLSENDRHKQLKERMLKVGQNRLDLAGLVNESGELVASLKKYTLSLNVFGCPQKTIGLGAVFRNEKYRKQGHAEQLIKNVLDEAVRAGFECALLYSDIGPDYYRRFGFHELDAKKWELRPISGSDCNDIVLKPATSTDILKLMNWYFATSQRFGLFTVRDELSWRLFHEINGIQETWIVEYQSREIGYLSCSKTSDGKAIWVHECCGDEFFGTLMFKVLQKTTLTLGVDGARGWLLPNIESALSSSTCLAIEKRTNAVPMMIMFGTKKLHFNEPSFTAYFSPADHF